MIVMQNATSVAIFYRCKMRHFYAEVMVGILKHRGKFRHSHNL
jgi:hypothetical protein